jgi:transposase
MLAGLKARDETDGAFLTRYDLTARFKGHSGDSVPATTVQTLADRLSKALNHYLRLKESRLPCGFPRFKTPNRWHSIQLRQYAPTRDVWLDEDGAHQHMQKNLSARTYVCPHCGLVEDRDVNAAKNILRAGAPPSGTEANGPPVELRSPRL